MFSGSMMGFGLQLIVTMILARLLSPADFGLLSAALVIIYFSEIFSSLGMGPALVQRKELEPRHISTGFTANFLFTTLLGLLIYLAAPAIAAVYRMPELVPILHVLALLFPIRGFAILSEALLKRAGQFRQLATADVVAYTVGYALVGVAMAWSGYGVWALVVATLAQTTLRSLLLFWRVPHSVRPHFERSAFQDLLGFGGGITLSNIANYFARQGDNFVVGRWLGATALGFYSKAFSLMLLPTSEFSKVIDEVLFPTLSQVHDNRAKLVLAYRHSLGVVALLVLPLSLFALLLAPELIQVVYGSGWQAAVIPFQVLCLSMFFRSAYKINGSIIKACGVVYNFASIQVIYAVLVVVGAIIAQQWGITAVAFTSALAIAVNYFLLSRISLRLTQTSWRTFIKWHIPGLLVSLILLVVLITIVSVLRFYAFSALVVLVAAAIAAGATLLLSFLWMPGVVGESGAWLLTWATHFLRSKTRIGRPKLKEL